MNLQELIDQLSLLDEKLPHCSNLKTKALSAQSGKGKEPSLVEEIVLHYLNYISDIRGLGSINESEIWIEKSLEHFEIYYSYLRLPKFKIFSHQSDFLSSLLPEFLYILYRKFVIEKYSEFVIETQKDLIIDLSFFPHFSPAIDFKFKRVDVAILKPCTLNVNNVVTTDFHIALVAVEVKTNLDKNMISGVEYSVQRFKRTFPLCKYYLLSEYADFAIDKQNYASTAIDEILIVRNQKRSEVRRDLGKIQPTNAYLINEHLKEILSQIELNVKKPTLLSQRLKKGKLIKL